LKNRAILPEKSVFLRPASPQFVEFWQPNGSHFSLTTHASLAVIDLGVMSAIEIFHQLRRRYLLDNELQLLRVLN
jgi:hypothetical protein